MERAISVVSLESCFGSGRLVVEERSDEIEGKSSLDDSGCSSGEGVDEGPEFGVVVHGELHDEVHAESTGESGVAGSVIDLDEEGGQVAHVHGVLTVKHNHSASVHEVSSVELTSCVGREIKGIGKFLCKD